MNSGQPTLIAIDPGALSGAYAAFRNGNGTTVGDLAVVDGQLDAAFLTQTLSRLRPAVAVVERVGAMPKQGLASTFKFGQATGIIHGVLAALEIPMHLVSPPVWKRPLGLIGKDKEAARALAIRLYPGIRGMDRKKDQNRAEALLIGHWFKHHKGDPVKLSTWRGALWPAGRGDDND